MCLSGCSNAVTGGDDASVDLRAGPDLAIAPSPDLSSVSEDMGVNARPYEDHVPAGYDKNKPTPLVILLHGYGGTGAIQDNYFKLTEAADAKGFLLALPDGTLDGLSRRFWNASDACCNAFAIDVDDVAYVNSIIDHMSMRYNVDPKRVFLVGHSNGGFMSHRAACDLSPRIAGIVALAGSVWKDAAKCQPSSPVAVLQVHGTADATILYAGGGPLYQGAGTYPGAVESTEIWAAKNGCDAKAVPSQQGYDLEKNLMGLETRVDVYQNCKQGAVELWTIEGGGHIPVLNTPGWGDALWGFLSAHPKP